MFDRKGIRVLWLLAGVAFCLPLCAQDGDGRRQRGIREKSRVDPAVVRAGQILRQAKSRGDLPGWGDPAPDFRLKILKESNPPDFTSPDGEGRVSLSSHRGKNPVALIFGSYT